MTTDDFEQSISRAQALGFLSGAQADYLREELTMFPIAGSVISHMLRKGMITPDQAKKLSAPPDEFSQNMQQQTSPGSGMPGSQPGESSAGQPGPYSLRPVSPPVPGTRPATPGEPPAKPAGSASSSGVYHLNTEPQQNPAPRKSISEALQASRLAMQTAEQSSATHTPASGTMSRPVAGQASSISVPRSSGPVTPLPQLQELFKMGRDRECSDLHLTVGKAPYLRQQGRLFFLPEQPMSASVIKQLVYSVLRPDQQQLLESDRQLDFSFEAQGNGRFRANVYYQRLGLEAAFRFIPSVVPTLKSLGLPDVLEKLTTYPQGLNLVTGPGGSGKTTTVAAMLEHINSTRAEHIITVEDPVEYVLQPKMCQVTQREVGTHTQSFADALRTALRQDPDVIMIGELRDLETTSIAITASETGHLVFGTLHTAGAIRTVARILDVYPPNQRQQICMMVAESLRGIISQQLLPRKDGQGRVCAMEILLVTTGVSQVIKEGKTHQLVSHMQSGRKLGMKSMDDALMELVQASLISGATAYNHAENKPAFEMIRNS